MIAGALRPAASAHATLDVEASREPGFVSVVARPLDGAPRPDLVVRLDAGASAPLVPRAPDRLEARLPATGDGPLVVRVTDRAGALHGAAVAPGAASLELAPPPRDLDLLRDLAATTGGTLLVAPPTPEHPLPRPAARAPLALAPWLALAALAFLLLEAALPAGRS
jgi:hypothetical protein